MKEVYRIYVDNKEYIILTDDQYYYVDDGFTYMRFPDLESAENSIC